MTELQVIKNKIRTHMNQIADELALGAARDFGEYKHFTGMIAALALVERDIIDLEEVQNSDN